MRREPRRFISLSLTRWLTTRILFQAGSRLNSAADIDRPGIRVAVPKGDSGELYLSRTLQHAELKSIPGLNPEAAQKPLVGARFPGLRMLPDNFFAVAQSIVVAKGNAAAFDFLN